MSHSETLNLEQSYSGLRVSFWSSQEFVDDSDHTRKLLHRVYEHIAQVLLVQHEGVGDQQLVR